MIDVTGYLIAVLIFLFTWILLRDYREWSRYPRGPYPIPFIGNLSGLILAGGLGEFLLDCRRKYGDVFTVTLGGEKQVVVCGEQNINKINYDLADYSSNRKKPFGRNSGIIYGKYPHWKMHRSFAIAALRSEGMGRSMLEPNILEEVDHYCAEYIQPYLGQPIEISATLNYASANVMSQLLYGSRSDYKDQTVQVIVDDLGRVMRGAMTAFLLNGLPYLGSFIAKRLGPKPETYAFLRKIIREAKEATSADDNEEPVGYLHRCIRYANQLKEDGHPPEYYDVTQLVACSRQLYSAGTETTATAMTWTFLYVIHYPDVQEKIYEEINGVIGRRAISQADKKLLPFTDSFLTEVLRLQFGIGIGLGLVKVLEIDAEISGKFIPAGSTVAVIYGTIARGNFKDFSEFRPDRFMNEGSADRKKFTAFGTGRRNCIGEPLALMELFIFFVSILQRYKLSAAPGEIVSLKVNKMNRMSGPYPYKTVITPR